MSVHAGLAPYVRHIRRCIKTGGRYLRRCDDGLSKIPHDLQVGIVFNKQYVWPGFHFFTAGTHVTTLERHGFEVKKMVNLSEHYAKTTAAWCARMMAQQDRMITLVGAPTFRAWQIFLAGITGTYLNKGIHLYRVYCEAVEGKEKPTHDHGPTRPDLRTRFVTLLPRHPASGMGVMVIPGAGWGASILSQSAARLTEAGHAVVLCDPCGTTANPGPFRYDDLWQDCTTHIAGWDVRRILLLAHSIGTHTAARLAASEERIAQIWIAPVPDGRRCFAALYATGQAGQFHRVLFEPPLTAAECAALEVLATDAWLEAGPFTTHRQALALPSRGGVRVPHLGDFLREVAHPGYVLGLRDSVRLLRVLVPPDDAWVPLETTQAFCNAAGVPVTILESARGHAVTGGWPTILEDVYASLVA